MLILSSILLLSLLPTEAKEILDLKHQPIAQGEWWRIFSSQVIHLSFNHTLLNFAGYAFVIFSFRTEVTPAREIIILLASATAVGLGIHFLNPEIYSYVGLSGAIYGVLVASVIIGINQTPGLSILFLAFLLGKFLFEYINGGASSTTEELIGGQVATDSHLYGAIAGLVPGILYYLSDKKHLMLNDTQRFVDQFKHPLVRDLAWTLHSTPLLNVSGKNFRSITSAECRSIAISFLDTLKLMDKTPEKLEKALDADNARLGLYFERLITFWLTHQNRFELIDHNLKVEENKKTIGEFDFIIKDKQNNEVIHCEVAVKFYLGVSPCNSLHSFHGPGKKDRLDIKTSHLIEKQIQLSDKPAAQETLAKSHIKIDKRIIFVKGRIFYPYQHQPNPSEHLLNALHRQHPQGVWYTVSELLALKPTAIYRSIYLEAKFHLTGKDEWLTLKHTDSASFAELKKQLKKNQIERPTVIIVSVSGKEKKRLFVVPDDWVTNSEDQ